MMNIYKKTVVDSVKNNDDLKVQVESFWGKKSCGEVYAIGDSGKERYEIHSKTRYKLEPYIHGFAQFHEGCGKDVLEIGVGLGGDYAEWAKSKPRSLIGIDLTQRAVEHTKSRLRTLGITSDVRVGDAEKLPFNDESFDIVYSWGVLHHSPNTSEAINQVYRVLRPDGIARVMIYHTYSLTGYMLWFRYALLRGNPFQSLHKIYKCYLQGPTTKAYSLSEARELFKKFSHIHTWTQLSFGDLLESAVGERHQGFLLSIAKKIWPRRFIKQFFKNHGLYLLIEAKK